MNNILGDVPIGILYNRRLFDLTVGEDDWPHQVFLHPWILSSMTSSHFKATCTFIETFKAFHTHKWNVCTFLVEFTSTCMLLLLVCCVVWL